MNKLYLLCLLPLILLIPQVSNATNTAITSILTNSGTGTPTTQGVITIIGTGQTDVTALNNIITISTPKTFYYIGGVTNHIWDYNNQQNFMNDQMTMQDQYQDTLAHVQPFNGTVTTISLTPIDIKQAQPLSLNLYDNGILVKNIQIYPKVGSLPISTVNYQFIKGDNLIWQIVTPSTQSRGFTFNSQVVFQYNP